MQAIVESQPPRRAWLAVIALGHVAVLMAWRPTARHAEDAARGREGKLLFLTQTPAVRIRPAEHPPRLPSAPHRRLQPDAPPASADAAPQSITLPAPAAADPADPFAKPAAPVESLLEKNRKLAASADRQLRKESLNQFATVVQEQSPLARQLGRAYKGEVVLEQFSNLGDGRTMKRFRAGGKEWCEYVNLVGAAGQDPFRDGNKVKVMSCP
ncbi:hypothetical protein [Pseudoduganella violaceinigra]|uniref:hypothetical protein n=1 Tax=Pseudoduganella violaceinigra TaxID=246602 RepID=UPI00040A9E04|nr:hypothetical protein [Pseudoduganella violaceinigra]